MSKLKIFHSADLHLGLRFSRYPEGLAEARFASLERMVEKANAEACDLFVVAGDLFDTLQVARKDIARAAKILARFEKVACVLPGNHDFYSGQSEDAQSDDFWRHFELPDHGRLLLLKEGRAYPLASFGIDAVVYSAPCRSKYSKTHALDWLAGTLKWEAKYHVGVAHGSFEGLSPDMQGDYFPMKKAELDRCQLDLWLLGHIHVQFPPRSPGQSDRIFYSGTHEPDGFDCRHEGKAWLLELSEDKSLAARSLSTGHYRFREEEVELHSLGALEAFSSKFSDDEARRTLIKLKVSGSLRREEHDLFGDAFEKMRARFFFVKADLEALGVRLSPEDIDRAYPKESFPHRLLTELAAHETDREALQAAFDLMRELETSAG
jgi:DNA repair protein SbcD/Mre11